MQEENNMIIILQLPVHLSRNKWNLMTVRSQKWEDEPKLDAKETLAFYDYAWLLIYLFIFILWKWRYEEYSIIIAIFNYCF